MVIVIAKDYVEFKSLFDSLGGSKKTLVLYTPNPDPTVSTIAPDLVANMGENIGLKVSLSEGLPASLQTDFPHAIEVSQVNAE